LLGIKARKIIDKARGDVAMMIGAKPSGNWFC